MSLPAQVEVTDAFNRRAKKSQQRPSYTKLLGLSKGQSGRPAYRGIVAEFYSVIQQLVDEVVGSYKWREEVQQLKDARETFYHEGIDNCLAQYGPKVWNDGVADPFTTSPEGVARLVYSNKDDQKKIRTYVYGWILQFAWDKLSKRPPFPNEQETAGSDTTNQSLHIQRSDEIILMPSGTHNLRSETVINSPRDSDTVSRREDIISPNERQYSAPEAQMVPNQPVSQASSPVLSRFRPSVVATGVPAARNNPIPSEGLKSHVEMAPEAPTYIPDNYSNTIAEGVGITSRHAARRNPSRKRRRSTVHYLPGTSFKALQSSNRTDRAPYLKRKGFSGGLSYPSPPVMDSDDLQHEEESGHAVIDATLSRNNNIPGRSTTTHPLPISPQDMTESPLICVAVTQPEPVIIPRVSEPAFNIQDDMDSVQGDPSEPQLGEDLPPTSAAEGGIHKLIVKLKLRNSATTLRLDRKRLALKLPDALDLSWEQPALLEETLELISSLRPSNAKSPLHQILNQWFELVYILVDFRKSTEFYGNQQAWNAHLDSLDPDARMSAMRCRIQASIVMGEWREKHCEVSVRDFCRDVTHIILGMADWMMVLNTADVEVLKGRMREFIQSILTWFT
ncbi:Nn.00g048210.m01.CDS01 [Neocucurbitaria sp. VM-36]